MFDVFFGRPVAYAKLIGSDKYPGIMGDAYFYPQKDGSLISIRVNGLPVSDEVCGKRFFALHIHAGSNCTGDDFSNTDGHYNPGSCTHPKHAGDLPPLLGCGKRAFMALLTDSFEPWDVIGRTIVVHESFDDFISQPAGNSGAKIACGEIKAM